MEKTTLYTWHAPIATGDKRPHAAIRISRYAGSDRGELCLDASCFGLQSHRTSLNKDDAKKIIAALQSAFPEANV